jgi:hypothetical protein
MVCIRFARSGSGGPYPVSAYRAGRSAVPDPMLLRTGPGQYAETPMFSSASSMCSVSDSAMTAAFVML